MKIAPGVRFNVNKRSVGVSVGARGARYSVNSDGRRTRSVGIPGTGLYYRSQTGPRPASDPAVRFSSPARLIAHGVGVLTVVAFAFGVINHWSFTGGLTAAGIIAYVVLRVVRPVLDPLIVWLIARNNDRSKTPDNVE